MIDKRQSIRILVADDSSHDCHLLQRAFQSAGVLNQVDFVHDGDELLQNLGSAETLPGLVILDINMPRMDGYEALTQMRADPRLETLPVVILTTSQQREDVLRCYRLGANSVVEKPMGYGEFVNLVAMLCGYWLQYVELP